MVVLDHGVDSEVEETVWTAVVLRSPVWVDLSRTQSPHLVQNISEGRFQKIFLKIYGIFYSYALSGQFYPQKILNLIVNFIPTHP